MKKYKDYIIIIIILSLIFISILVITSFNKEDNSIDTKKVTYKLENDYNNFFTVNGCITKYVEYLSKKNTTKLLQVLDKEYVKNNNINIDNIYSILPNLEEGMYSFTSKMMYKDDGNTIVNYYVYGYLNKEIIDSVLNKEDNYYMVKLDKNNMVYSIKPITISEFNEVKNG